MQVVDLVAVPDHRAAVADRIWRAWWEPSGAVLADVEQALSAVMAAKDYPSFTLVAIDDETFCGTVTVIEQDISDRPELGPCIAALWVEPAARGGGLGERLLTDALGRLALSGFSEAFLAARAPLRGFYLARGWALRETDVGADQLDVFVHALPVVSPRDKTLATTKGRAP